MSTITIGNREVGPGHPCYIVAELSGNHNQSYETAVELVNAAHEAGADAVKLQTYTPDTMTIDCDNEHFRIGSGMPWAGKTLHELYGETFTPWEWYPELRSLCDTLGMDCFSSPFDATAVEFLERWDAPAYKIASFELVDLPLIARVAQTGKPIIMSTGLASFDEINEAVEVAWTAGAEDLILLACTSSYPAPSTNLAQIGHLTRYFGVVSGLSDHTAGTVTAGSAVACGASVVEKHICLLGDEAAPDASFSLDPHEFGRMVLSVRAVEKADGAVQYGPTEAEKPSMIFRRSLFAVEDIGRGERLTVRNVRSIRPGNGLHTRHLSEVLGRRATVDIDRGTPLRWELFK